MVSAHRRRILGVLAGGAGALTATRVAASDDGHAHGHDVSAVAEELRMRTIPRKMGDAPAFSISLDTAPVKATSGGWAREITTRQLPLATGIAFAHLFVGPGGMREMHWHSSAEWAYVLDGACQVTVVDPEGEAEVANLEAGDVWYFPAGYAHAIQTLGDSACHALLAFNDGLYGEHGTFGLTDLLSRLDPGLLGRTLQVPETSFRTFPPGETYIMQGPVLSAEGSEARTAQPLESPRSFRHRLMVGSPFQEAAGGSMRLASAREFPRSQDMSGYVLTLAPKATQAPHWHTNANEMVYIARGTVRATLFGPDKHLGQAILAAGDCAYFPRACAHLLENVGETTCEIVGVTDSGTYSEAPLADWFTRAPRHMLAANLGVAPAALPSFARTGSIIAG